MHTVMHMTFGQFLAHDNERTAVTKLSKNDDGIRLLMFIWIFVYIYRMGEGAWSFTEKFEPEKTITEIKC